MADETPEGEEVPQELPVVNIQAVVEALMERIGSLELEVAILRSMLGPKQSQQESWGQVAPKDRPKDPETGQYL